MDALRAQLNSLNATTPHNLSSTSTREVGGNAMLLKRFKEAENEIIELKKQIVSLERSGGGNSTGPGGGKGGKGSTGGGGGGSGADPSEIKALQKRIRELESGGGGGGGGAAEKKAIATIEKKYEKQAKELEKVTRKEKAALESRVNQLETDITQVTSRCHEAEIERDQLRQHVHELSQTTTEIETLKMKVLLFDDLTLQLQQTNQQINQLTSQYKKESQLRKQYKNELEDLKGAIRVYARARPMAQYEIDKDCQKIIEFPDDSTVLVHTSRGNKEYEFDTTFTDLSTQEAVFEDTKRLIESFLDGFNVCLFAYGQTGSGKTFTMTGSPSSPGLTPRAITEMFRLIHERTHCTSRVSTYFVELYNDNLVVSEPTPPHSFTSHPLCLSLSLPLSVSVSLSLCLSLSLSLSLSLCLCLSLSVSLCLSLSLSLSASLSLSPHTLSRTCIGSSITSVLVASLPNLISKWMPRKWFL
jgi:hypothetical protein